MAKKSRIPAKAKPLASKLQSDGPVNPLELAAPLVGRVRIHEVVLAESITRRSADADMHDGGVHVAIDIGEVEFGREAEFDQFFVKPTFLLTATKKDLPDDELLLFITASFVLIYSASSLGEFTDEQIEAFAKTSGIYNAWPYWREFAQSTAARMGLPPVMVPVFRFPEPE